uniref:P2X purinoreceptor 7 intracellular domain-containing protein n=1 Tax=Nothobranchius furzeri TaxID=105023 RepID=A0A8C6NSQ6_NOTFU
RLLLTPPPFLKEPKATPPNVHAQEKQSQHRSIASCNRAELVLAMELSEVRKPTPLWSKCHNTSNQPSWCVCSHCRDMPTDLEKKCCQKPPQTCISTVPHMEESILQNGVLRLARTLWNEFRAVYDDPDPGEDNRQFRHAAYRQFVAWQHGKPGGGRRVVIPSCVVWRIREKFRDPNSNYTAMDYCVEDVRQIMFYFTITASP